MYNEEENSRELPAVLLPQPALRSEPYVRIIEQPAMATRFRYPCEGGGTACITGISSTVTNKTYPTIQVVGYEGKTVVVVSCVTSYPPYRPHPYNIAGRIGCVKGVCTLPIPTSIMTIEFKDIRIQCVKKNEIALSLALREQIRVDPFRTGFEHRSRPQSIDFSTLRLCFQVFRRGEIPGRYTVPFPPIVSQPILDKRYLSCLNIVKISECASYVDGGPKDIIILCGPISSGNIKVRFYENPGHWEAYAEIKPYQVHRQCSIWFRPPKYKCLNIEEPVIVYLHLLRPSDGATGNPVPFQLLPLMPRFRKRKRQKMDSAVLDDPKKDKNVDSTDMDDFVVVEDDLDSPVNNLRERNPEYLPRASVSLQNVAAAGPSTSNMQYNIPFQRESNIPDSEILTAAPTEHVAQQNFLNFDDKCIDSKELQDAIESMDVNPDIFPEIESLSGLSLSDVGLD